MDGWVDMDWITGGCSRSPHHHPWQPDERHRACVRGCQPQTQAAVYGPPSQQDCDCEPWLLVASTRSKVFFYDKEREAKLLLRVQEEEHDLFEKKKKNTTTVRRRHRVRTSISLGTFSREDSRRTLAGLISCTSPPGIVLVNFVKNPVQKQLLIQ